VGDELRRKELAAFLRARRGALKPEDVGLADGFGRRRTPGLRREEVTQLSGVGLTWYTWLEQARDIPASRQVVQALAAALRLDADDTRHLYHLAGLPEPRSQTAPDDGDVLDTLRRTLASLTPNPAYAIDECFYIVAWNRAQAALWLDPGQVKETDRNLLWLMLTDASARSLVVDWEDAAQRLVGRFRAATSEHAGDPRFGELSDRLAGVSPEFAQWWNGYPVADFDVQVNQLDHPRVGRLDMDLLHLRVVEHPGLTVVLQTPRTPEDAARAAALVQDSDSASQR